MVFTWIPLINGGKVRSLHFGSHWWGFYIFRLPKVGGVFVNTLLQSKVPCLHLGSHWWGNLVVLQKESSLSAVRILFAGWGQNTVLSFQ
jgi:hypothetical protein